MNEFASQTFCNENLKRNFVKLPKQSSQLNIGPKHPTPENLNDQTFGGTAAMSIIIIIY